MEAKTIQVTHFIRPNGRKEIITVPKVYPDDADYINKNKIDVSIEYGGFDFIVWLNDGKVDEEGEPDEIMLFAEGRTCEEVLKEGVQLLKDRKK